MNDKIVSASRDAKYFYVQLLKIGNKSYLWLLKDF